tara:strand:- start:307 stop:903 length:597 start_codon:yes stop_codon:yes gene_type:complete
MAKINFSKFYDNYINKLYSKLNEINKNKLLKSAQLIESTIKDGKKIFVCGNGGSHAIANHYVCDYFKVLSQETPLKPKILSLCSSNELISAISNDISYSDIFLYQAERLIEKGDIVIIISSSGNSKNIIKLLKYLNKRKIKSIGFTGFMGGYLKSNCSISVHSNINNYGISEDISHIIMHELMQYLKIKNSKKKQVIL